MSWFLVINHDTGDSRKYRVPNVNEAIQRARSDNSFKTEHPVQNDVAVYALQEDQAGDPRSWHIDEFR